MMLDAAAQALSQMLSPPFRSVLLKSIGLALILIVIMGIGLDHVLNWLTGSGEGWAENAAGPNAHLRLAWLIFAITIAAGLGIVVGSVFVMPAVTALVASFLVDDMARAGERGGYPGEPEGKPLPLLRAVIEGV